MSRVARLGCVLASGAVLAIGLSARPAAALTFNFSPDPGTPQNVIDGFNEAADLWSNIITDNVTIRIDIGFPSLPSGVLGQTGSRRLTYSYSSVRSALVSDASSQADLLATGTLPAGPDLDIYINRTSNNPNGSGSATPYLDNDGDANNTTIRMTSANAKALGLNISGNPNTSDATIQFSSNFSWDFDRSNGISGGTFDFVGVAAHEIGHALGFISGVDILDANSPPNAGPFPDHDFTYVSTPDIFRFSTGSLSAGGSGTIDWAADNRTKSFSIDGGTTTVATFSTGVTFGDGRQASHWEDNLGIGLMDPTFAAGELGVITAKDRLMFNIIGWDIADLPGDANLDGTVNGLDLSALAANWQSSGASWQDGDFNGDGIVNGLDLSILAQNWVSPLSAGGVGFDEQGLNAATHSGDQLVATCCCASCLIVSGSTTLSGGSALLGGIPEPGAAALLLAGGAMGLLRRPRRRAT